MKRMIQWSLILVVAVHITGCVAISHPKVTVQSVEVVNETDDASSLLFHGMVENPHSETLRLLEFSYTVSMKGQSIYQGRHAAEMTLTPGATRQFTLPAGFTNAAAGLSSDAMPESSKWSMGGSLLFLGDSVLAETLLDMGLRPTVDFSASGDLQWSRAAAATER